MFSKELAPRRRSEWSGTHTTAIDESVASILSQSDSLIPDAFMPVDIQVLGRPRRASSRAHGSNNSLLSSSSGTGLVTNISNSNSTHQNSSSNRKSSNAEEFLMAN